MDHVSNPMSPLFLLIMIMIMIIVIIIIIFLRNYLGIILFVLFFMCRLCCPLLSVF